MTEEQVKNGQRITKQLEEARTIKKELEDEHSYFVIALKSSVNYGHTIDFKNNNITRKFFPAIEDYIGSYLHGLIDNEIKHLENELENI